MSVRQLPSFNCV